MRPCYVCGRTKIDHPETPCFSRRYYTPERQPLPQPSHDWVLGVVVTLLFCVGLVYGYYFYTGGTK